VIRTRATILTAYDLAHGERGWRDVSPVEQAHREKPAERKRHARKEQQRQSDLEPEVICASGERETAGAEA
jgi:hypothetical protein